MRGICFSAAFAVLLVGACIFGIFAPHAQGASFTSLKSEFDELLTDPSRAGLRDSWLNLEKKFAQLEAESSGEEAASAAFYHARSRQELGRRSFSSVDHKEAVKLFAHTAEKYPKSRVAPESLVRQGGILYRLGHKKAAVPILEKLVTSYPKSPVIAEAQAMLHEYKGGKPAAQAAPPAAAAKTPAPASGKTAATPSAAKNSVTLKNITWTKKGQRAIVTLELDNTASVAHNFLPPDAARKTPGRLYLDIAGALPHESLKNDASPKGLVVTGIRTGKTEGGTRVTLECDGVQCYVVRSPKGSPQIIQIEVSRKEDIKGGISVSQPAAVAAPAKKGAKPSSSVIEQLGLTVKTIMLDAGHGGHDPGAQGGGITEKQFTLAMARKVGAMLKKEGFTVLFTRADDTFISLQDRPEIANDKNVDLFVSIHVNANPKNTVFGLETYYLSEARSKDAAVVAARENGVSIKNISDLQFILTDLMLSTKLKESRHLAKCVHNGILNRLKSAKLAAFDNGVRSAPFYVLMGARMPAILIEFGYISNERDCANLRDEAFIQRQAEGVVRGIVQYRAEIASLVPGSGN